MSSIVVFIWTLLMTFSMPGIVVVVVVGVVV